MDYDIQKIKESIEILKPNNALYEIRILQGSGKRKTIISGYFKGTKNLERAFKTVNLSKANVFLTLNDIDNDCYSREQHEKFVQIDDTTGDTDITAYRWFLVDVDPKRKSRISSTDEELEYANQKAEEVENYLNSLDFPRPIRAMSGNGRHLLYAIHLQNTQENEDLIQKCLENLSELFTDDHVDIDVSVFNPSRISKLYGTIARKGADTEERPHRLSRILSVPKDVAEVPRTLLEELAAVIEDKRPQNEPEKIKKPSAQEFNVETWLSDHGIEIDKTTSTKDGATKYILQECPFDSSHKAPDSMVIVQKNGAIGFRCLHNSCSGRTWQDLRLKFEPDAYDDKRAEDEARIEEGWKKHKQYMLSRVTDDVEEIKRNLPQIVTISARELQQKQFPETYYAVEGMIPEGETVIAAPPKTGKSWLMLDMCLKVAKGEKFLDFATHRSDTLYLALEDGDKFEQERLNIVCPEEAPENFHFVFDNILHLNEGFTLQLDEMLKKLPNTKLVVIDTLNFIQYHPAKGESAYNCDYRTGRDLKSYAEKHGIAIVVVTHTTKMLHAEDEMMNVSGTNGVTGAADAVVVLSKEKRTDLDAKLFITGRKVRQSMHEIRFNDQKCKWEYRSVADVGDKDQRERDDREQKYLNSKIRKVLIRISSETQTFWRGKAAELIEKAVEYKIGLREGAREVGGFLKDSQGLMMDIDGIPMEIIQNGNAPKIYKIYPKEETEGDVFEGFIPY